MTKCRISRRRFIQGTASVGAALASMSSFRLLTGGSSAVAEPQQGVTYAQNWCEMCFWKCGLTAKVVNGKVRKLEGQPDCPSNYGKLCAKGNAGVFQLYDPDRLKTPLIRDGERGSGKFRKATWEEAIAYVAQKTNELKEKYGPETFSLFCHGSGQDPFIQMMEIMGSPNICVPSYSQCTGSRDIGWALSFGKPVGGKEPVDSQNSKCMMLLGRNIVEALHVGEMQDFVEGVAKGAHVIYVDPRFTKTAAKANQYMMIKPGTDSALLLGMINYIIEKEIYNKDFVDSYTYGFEQFRKHVAGYTVEWASQITEIPQEEIIKAAEKLCKAAPRSYVHPGRRLTRYGNDTQFTRIVACLNMLLGNWEVRGGLYRTIGFKYDAPSMIEYDKPYADRADGAGGENFPLGPKNLGFSNGTIKAIAEQSSPLKGMFIYGCNPLHHHGNTDTVRKAIENTELIVTCEIYMTDTAWYSDVILPESTYLERTEPVITTGRRAGFVQYREKAVDPVFETLGSWDMVSRLLETMGYENKFMDISEYNRQAFESLGVDEEYMKKNGIFIGNESSPYPVEDYEEEPSFRTPSGKAEFYSNLAEHFSYPPMPSYEENPVPAEGEFRLLFGRISFHTHARTQNNAWLLALHKSEVPLWIHTERAKALGIKDGMQVRLVKEGFKSNPCTAKVVDYIHPQAVFLPYGFGHESKGLTRIAGKGARTSDFTSDLTDPISGAAGFHNGFVKIEIA
ncbi:MAG: molybdopterin-dependent oxidoreductase [Deferribacterales bacterium]